MRAFMKIKNFANFLLLSLLPIFAVTDGVLAQTISVESNRAGLRAKTIAVGSLRAIGGVDILLRDRNGNQNSVSTSMEGDILVVDLDPGLYEVTASKEGYATVRLPSVRMVKGKITPLTIKMSLPQASLEEMLVVGTVVVPDKNSVGASILDREGLRSAAGSGSDVLRALDGMPGLFSGGQYSSYNVRGAGPRDNLILVDGVPFENVVHFTDAFGQQEELEGGGRYSVFAPNTIAEAEFQPGGWGPKYGGKSGSLLKLNVAEGNRDSAFYTVRLDIAGGEVGYDGPSRIHDDTSLLFSARSYDFSRLFKMVGLEEIGEPKLTDIILKSSTELGNDGKLNLLMIHAPESYSRDMEHVLASETEDASNYKNVDLIEAEKDNQLFSVQWHTWLPGDWKLENQAYYRRFQEESSSGEAYPDLVPLNTPSAEIPRRDGILLSNREENERGLRLDLTKENSLGEFNAGLEAAQTELKFDLTLTGDWKRYTFEESDFRPDPDRKYIELTPQLVNNSYEHEESNYVVYLNQGLSLGNVDTRFGARWEQDNFSDESLFSPRLGAAWAAADDIRMTVTAGRYYQTASFADRALDPRNNDLENEIVDQLSLGVSYLLKDDLTFFVEPYYQELSNLIVEQDGVDQTYGNTGSGQSWGVDTALTRSFDDGWSADIKYSYNQAELKDQKDGTYYDADFNRPHSFSIGGVWEINDRWKLSSRWKWASGQPKDEAIIHDNVLGDGEPLRYSKEFTSNNTKRYGTYSSLNLRIDYRRNIGRTNIVAFFDVINLLGAKNPNSETFNERTGEDEPEEGGALPLVGFRLEW